MHSCGLEPPARRRAFPVRCKRASTALRRFFTGSAGLVANPFSSWLEIEDAILHARHVMTSSRRPGRVPGWQAPYGGRSGRRRATARRLPERPCACCGHGEDEQGTACRARATAAPQGWPSARAPVGEPSRRRYDHEALAWNRTRDLGGPMPCPVKSKSNRGASTLSRLSLPVVMASFRQVRVFSAVSGPTSRIGRPSRRRLRQALEGSPPRGSTVQHLRSTAISGLYGPRSVRRPG